MALVYQEGKLQELPDSGQEWTPRSSVETGLFHWPQVSGWPNEDGEGQWLSDSGMNTFAGQILVCVSSLLSFLAF